MFITMGISIYTSRIVLAALGIEDYGIYNIVGGIVIFFIFINTALIGSTQRFLNYALGEGNQEKLSKTFGMCLSTHLVIAIIIFIMAETIGLYFINNVVEIPSNRFDAAQIVYQLSILVCCVNIIRTPFNATIIAHERMSFYAYLSIGEGILKLSIAYIILFVNQDKLITYAFLTLLVSIIITFSYIRYCIKNFSYSKYYLFWDKSFYKEYINFSGWSLLGSFSNAGVQQGINILINIFSGVIANAAYGISNQVSVAVYGFVSNFQMAFNPQLVQSHASGNKQRFETLIYQTSKFSYFLLLIIALPIIVCMPILLSIWLKDVPNYSVDFCRWTLIFLLIDALSAPLWISVQAIGNIKKYQIIMSILIILNIPISYILLRLDLSIIFIFIIRVFINICSHTYRLHYLIGEKVISWKAYLYNVIVPVIVTTIIALSPLLLLIYTKINNISMFITSILCVMSSILGIYRYALKENEREFLIHFVLNKITHND